MPTGYCRQCSRPFVDLRRRLCGTCYQRARKIHQFRWHDAAPVREHLLALHAAGLGQRRIAELARVDRSQIRNLTVGRRAQDRTYDGPARFCHPKTAAAILAIPIPDPDPKAIEWRQLHAALNPRQTPKRYSRKPGWKDRYAELRHLGYSDIEIMRRLDSSAEAMCRQMARYQLTPQPALLAECRHEQDHRKARSA
jgi:hypothetical protein